MGKHLVRPAEERDDAQVAELMAELGYHASPEMMRQKIKAASSSGAGCACVAEDEERIVGVVSVHALPLFHAEGSLGRITALVVRSSHQRAGVGSDLIEAAEAFARSRGCVKMEVTSGSHREGAHSFYKKVGYEQSAHERFTRSL